MGLDEPAVRQKPQAARPSLARLAAQDERLPALQPEGTARGATQDLLRHVRDPRARQRRPPVGAISKGPIRTRAG